MCCNGRIKCFYLPDTCALAPQEILPTENFSFGEALADVYPLLDLIFSYLPSAELKNIMQLNEKWKKAAERELKKRDIPGFIWAVKKVKKKPYQMLERNLSYANSVLGIVSVDGVRLETFVCIHSKNKNVERMRFAEFLERFVTKGQMDYCVLKCLMWNSEENIHGIFGALLLPQIPNVRIDMFEVCKFPIKRDDYVNSNEEVKGLIILADSYEGKYGLKKKFLYRYIQGDDSEKVAFAGALVNGIKCFYMTGRRNAYIPENRILCFSFLQEIGKTADFNVSSIVIKGDSSDEESFKANLQKLKNRSVLRENRIAFYFCCKAKNEKSKSKEYDLFIEVFPGTMLSMLHVNSKFGWDSFNKEQENNEPPKKPKTGTRKINREWWKSIIFLLSWGKTL